MAQVWHIRSEAAPLWFIWVSSVLCAHKSDSTTARASLESGCSFWVNKTLPSVYQRDLFVDWEMQLFFPRWLWLLPATVLNYALFSEEFITLAKPTLRKSSSYVYCVHPLLHLLFVFFFVNLWSDDALFTTKSWSWQIQPHQGKPEWSQSSVQWTNPYPTSKPCSLWYSLDFSFGVHQRRSHGSHVLCIILDHMDLEVEI